MPLFGFFFTDTRNTAQGYTDSYGGAANDVFYKFTQTRSTDIYFRLEDAPGDAVVYYVLDEHGNEIYRAHAQENPSYSYYTRECLYLGTYYLVAESSARSLSVPVAEEGLLTVCVEYIPRLPGEDFRPCGRQTRLARPRSLIHAARFFIFRLRIHIFRLKIHILSLRIHILSLRMKFLHGWPEVSTRVNAI